MVKQNKQINDRNSNQVKAQKKENKEQTSKKKNHIRLKRKSKFKAKYIKIILKNNGYRNNRKQKRFNTAKKIKEW